MNLGSWLLLGAVAVWLVVALVHIVRNRGNCCGCGGGPSKGRGCCGDCANCGCSACHKERGKSEE